MLVIWDSRCACALILRVDVVMVVFVEVEDVTVAAFVFMATRRLVDGDGGSRLVLALVDDGEDMICWACKRA